MITAPNEASKEPLMLSAPCGLMVICGQHCPYIKGQSPKPDKVLLARKFLQEAKKGTVVLDDESKANITALFKEIEFK